MMSIQKLLKNVFIYLFIYSTNNINQETDIGIQHEDQKNKADGHSLLPLPLTEMTILPP